MPQIDPKWTFYLTLLLTFANVGANATVWSGAVPHDVGLVISSWCGIVNTFGTPILSLLVGQHMTEQGRIASAAAVPGVEQIQTTQAIADAAPSDKVVPFKKAA